MSRAAALVFPLWILAGTALGVWQEQPAWVAGMAVVALAAMTAAVGPRPIGWANGLTWLRIIATAALVVLPASSLPLALVAFAIFALDGADGALARSLGTTSNFGADLDKECDAFFVLMLSVLLWTSGHAGLWALLPGLWRYAYSLLIGLAVDTKPAPRSNWGRYSYSASCLCLIAALWQQTPMPALLVAVAATLISLSFLRSLYYCFARR